MIQQPDNDDASLSAILLNEKGKTERPYRTTPVNGTTDKPKWILNIYYDETVNGIHQIEINGSENRSKFIGTRKGTAVRIELMDGKKVETLTFSGLN